MYTRPATCAEPRLNAVDTRFMMGSSASSSRMPAVISEIRQTTFSDVSILILFLFFCIRACRIVLIRIPPYQMLRCSVR